MSIEFTNDEKIEVENATLPSDNTITKALDYLRINCGIKLPKIHVKLVKNIPMQAGLGGGSSNAAAILNFGFEWAKENHDLINDKIIRQWIDGAWVVGADVPFFLFGGRAIGTGYGETLLPITDIEPVPLIVIKPIVGCPTGLAYSMLDQIPRPFRQLPSSTGFLDDPYNDFDRVAPVESLELIDELWRLGASAAMLSGSGSAVFGAFHNFEERNIAFNQLKNTTKLQVYSSETTKSHCSLRELL